MRRTAAQPQWWRVSTPVGALALAGDEEALYFLRLPSPGPGLRGQQAQGPAEQGPKAERANGPGAGLPGAVARAQEQLLAYFAGDLTSFDVPLRPAGTPWQQKVWRALVDVPFGETKSYRDIARQVGNPRAARAVGMALNRNPIAIIIPCHRVVGADGSLTGYGGGLALKERLLAHERRAVAGLPALAVS